MSAAYGMLMIAGTLISAWLWRTASAGQRVPILVFVGGLIGSVLGAKLGYFVAELPLHWGRPDFWPNVLIGRTLLGGLLGGYAGVEWGKREAGHVAPTGDGFALAVPIGLAIGRIGCWIHGCCPGRACSAAWYSVTDAADVARYPVAPVEIVFDVAFVVVAWGLARRGVLRGQLFHLYLLAYGVLRLLHEPLRDTPRIAGPVTGYQVLAGLLISFAIWRIRVRRTEMRARAVCA